MRIAVVLGLLVACTEQDVEVEETVQTIVVYDEEPQGRWLLGSVPDRLTDIAAGSDHLSALADSTSHTGLRVSVESGSLVVKDAAGATVYSGTDAGLVGIELVSSGGVALRIDGAFIDAFGGPVYDLAYKDTTGKWLEYCEAGEAAVPMQGTWSSTGFHRSGTNVSFGCRDGTTFKCFTWGYIPGAAGSVAWDAHQACTRMARADFCGDGIPHTRELTPIVIRDYLAGFNDHPGTYPALQHAPSHPAPPDQHWYESSWKSGENVGAVCLSRMRWASLPIGFGCPALSDPRVTPGAKFCEQMSDDELIAAGAELANASKTQDMYLHQWRNPATNDVVSTVRGLYGVTEPFPGYTEYLRSDGIVLRNLPGSISRTEVVEVFSKGTGDRVLLPDPSLTRSDPSFEGYLLQYDGGDRVPFNLYRGAGNDLLTSIEPKDPSFVFEHRLYYVITP